MRLELAVSSLASTDSSSVMDGLRKRLIACDALSVRVASGGGNCCGSAEDCRGDEGDEVADRGRAEGEDLEALVDD